MQSFKWQKKVKSVDNGSKSLLAFKEYEKEIEEDVDWLTATKRAKIYHLEDVKIKAERLTEEGITFAGSERWWEAIGRWNSVLAMDDNKFKIHDMVAQAYLKVGEIYPAMMSATKAIQLAPNWWPGLQTHGRAHLSLGEVEMAVKSFSKAIHLQPDEKELWKEDLQWAVNLMNQRKVLLQETKRVSEMEQNELTLEEISKCSYDDSFVEVEETSVKKSSDEEVTENGGNDSSIPSSVITCTSKRKRDRESPLPVAIPTLDPCSLVCYRN